MDGISDEALVRAIAEAVARALKDGETGGGDAETIGSDMREVVIGVGPAFQDVITRTINGLPLEDVLREMCAGVEEEGMTSRVIKVYKTSDVAFIGKEAARASGSGIGIGLQSKGTAIIHQRDLHPLSNLELFPQSPLMSLADYRRIGGNAAKYAKSKRVSPLKVMNDPMVRAAYQVKAALMHIKETEHVNKNRASEAWGWNG